jgi:two-component system, chemotaxis family, chemotaxis protein CheY
VCNCLHPRCPLALTGHYATAPYEECMAPPPQVLIVEDDAVLRRGVAEVLMDGGFRTQEARSGREALQLLREGATRPQVVVLDLRLPDMNGSQFRAEQLADETIRGIPVVGIAGDRGQAEAPCDAVVRMPFGSELLISTLVDVVARRGVG